MNKIQLRKLRNQLKAERLAILQEIDELEIKLKNEKDRKERDRLTSEIKRLGGLLQEKVILNISDHDHVEEKEMYQDYATGKREGWSIPIEMYLSYKSRGFTDKKIAELFGGSPTKIARWKIINGLSKPRKQAK